MYVAPMAPMI